MFLIALTLFGLFFLLLLMEAPVAVCLGLSAAATLFLFSSQFPLDVSLVIAQTIFSAFDSFVLLSIPLFLVAGYMLGESTLSRHLLDFVMILFGRVRGGTAVVTVVVSLLFAGISGSGPADVAALGILLYPLLVKSGFEPARSASLLAAGGGIGIIMPPSIALILYGVVSETSINALFLAGVIPGILVSLALIVAVLLLARSDQPAEIPPLSGQTVLGTVLALMAPVIILGGIYLSLFTPTESAAAAVLYIFLADLLFYRTLFTRKAFENVLVYAGRSSAQILMIIAGASLFSYVLHLSQLTESLGHAILGITNNPILLLLLINALVLALGCFIDAVSIIIVFVPIFLAPLKQVGIDPIHFGILLTVNLAIGQITPPVGVNLFVASTISKLNVAQISRAVLPFILAELVALLLLTFIPGLSLWLPGVMTK